MCSQATTNSLADIGHKLDASMATKNIFLHRLSKDTNMLTLHILGGQGREGGHPRARGGANSRGDN